jgi:hypothetical protein
MSLCALGNLPNIPAVAAPPVCSGESHRRPLCAASKQVHENNNNAHRKTLMLHDDLLPARGTNHMQSVPRGTKSMKFVLFFSSRKSAI